jgi:hypothetical protein
MKAALKKASRKAAKAQGCKTPGHEMVFSEKVARWG